MVPRLFGWRIGLLDFVSVVLCMHLGPLHAFVLSSQASEIAEKPKYKRSEDLSEAVQGLHATKERSYDDLRGTHLRGGAHQKASFGLHPELKARQTGQLSGGGLFNLAISNSLAHS